MRAIAIHGLVRRLLILEAGEGQDQGSLIEAVERVLDKLRAHLSNRVGQEGFRTLLVRALSLAAVSFPLLRSVRVGADGCLVGLHGVAGADAKEIRNHTTQQEAIDGGTALVAHLLALLVTFIGEDLMLVIIRAIWPELAFEDAAEWENERP